MRAAAILSTTLLSLAGLLAIVEEPRDGHAQESLLPVDETMLEIAAATGGDFYFWEPGEFAALAGELRLPLGGEDVLLAYGELEGSARAWEVPVDTVTTRLEVFAGAQAKRSFRVRRPDGTPLVDDRPRVRIQDSSHMRLATVEHPEPGVWRVELEGRGRYALTARVSTDSRSVPPGTEVAPIQLISFTFVRPGGRPGHEGLFPYEAEIAAGEERSFRVSLSGSHGSAEVVLVDPEGRVLLESEEVARIPGEWPADRIYGTLRVPQGPFRVVVRGYDLSGAPYRRVYAPLHGSRE